MSATRMLVLGVMHWAGRAHGYQVRTELVSWSADTWARIKPGSIYHAIRKAASDGLLEQDSTEPGDGGPDRVAYRITPEGRAELHRLVREGLSTPGDPWMLNAAIAMLPVLDRDEVRALLATRIKALDENLAQLRAWRANPGQTPEHVLEQANLWVGQTRADQEWAAGLLDRLNAGGLQLPRPPASLRPTQD